MPCPNVTHLDLIKFQHQRQGSSQATSTSSGRVTLISGKSRTASARKGKKSGLAASAKFGIGSGGGAALGLVAFLFFLIRWRRSRAVQPREGVRLLRGDRETSEVPNQPG